MYEKFGKLVIGGKEYKACWNFGAQVEMQKQRKRIEALGRGIADGEYVQILTFAATRCGRGEAPTLEEIEVLMTAEEARSNFAEIGRLSGIALDGGLPPGKSDASATAPSEEAQAPASPTQETS